ncbi:hypothetical protein FOB82_06505 [Corynebacterium xerosis]|uniref:Phage infection protein n=1 Tax=Corynebacterium xerosis TaxID=1725 RepID=A0A6B8TGC8_9CORY|nr:hypothetical protein [Corynebacterium xerosis]QGS34654.1 hypothetical protein FOB82_06505 [Corynebacterium xerosis]
MAPRKGGIRRTLLSLLLILPLIAVAAYLGWAGIGPSAAWTADGAEEGRAPGPVPGIDVGQVQDARRAIGEAGTQAGFLNAGMGQATEGIGELKDGGTELVDGTGQVRKGAADLATGMTELQAGTGRLGAGAKEIAAGAGTIADNVGLVNVAVGQVEAALGPAKEALRASGDPNAGDAVADLEALERQLATVDFDAIAGEAERFRRGADDMSYQLNTPGAPYRDGIYNATAGAAELRTGTEELDEGAKKLDGGLRELDEGAGRLDGMAQTTVDKIGDAQRAMPVPTRDQLAAAGLAGDAGDGGEGAAAGSNATLAPTLAFMVSALVMLAASALWLIDGPRRRGRGVAGAAADIGADASAAGWWGRVLPGGAFAGALAGIVAIGALVLFIMADGMDLLRGATSVIVLALAALAATALSRAVMVVFGSAWGRAVILAGMLVQVGVIGWVWRTAATAASGGTELATAWGVAAALLPLHHPTAALTTLGNAGSTVMWGTSAGVLLALVVIGALIDRFGGGRRRAAAAATTSPEPATTKSPTPIEAETATPGDDGATTGDARNDAGDPADGDEGGVVKRNAP